MRKGRILCVEDEEDVLRMEVAALQALGYEVISSSNAIEALEIFRQEVDTIALVMADIVMPGITGTDLATQVHSVSPQTPIILVTGHTPLITTELTEEVMAIGVKRILEKPFTNAELRQALAEALTGG